MAKSLKMRQRQPQEDLGEKREDHREHLEGEGALPETVVRQDLRTCMF